LAASSASGRHALHVDAVEKYGQLRAIEPRLGDALGDRRQTESSLLGEAGANCVHDTDELVMVIGRRRVRDRRQGASPFARRRVPHPARARHTVRNLGRGESCWLYG